MQSEFKRSMMGELTFFSQTTNLAILERYVPLSEQVLQKAHSKVWHAKLKVIIHSNEFHMSS